MRKRNSIRLFNQAVVMALGLLWLSTGPASANEPPVLRLDGIAAEAVDAELFIEEIEEFAGDVRLVQVERAPADPATTDEPKPADDKPADGQPADDEPVEGAAPAPTADLPPKFIRLHLMDGTVISGDLSVDEITVTTEFGELTIPISRIIRLTPGLDSHPEVAARIDELIQALGAEDYNQREAAHKELVKMGLKVRSLVAEHKDSENAELKKHVEQILKEFDELQESLEDLDDQDSASELVEHDKIVTPKFTVVGKVSPDSFTISSKYGPLNIRLADLRTGEREAGAKEPVLRKLSVPGLNLVQRSFKSSGIRINRGDRISMTAEGQIVMSPWGNNSVCGPDGGPNYGWYEQNKIAGGALVAKIGESGEVFKVGSKYAETAKRTGTLYFAIAMNPSYAGEGYNYPGQYSVRVKVEPQ